MKFKEILIDSRQSIRIMFEYVGINGEGKAIHGAHIALEIGNSFCNDHLYSMAVVE